MRTLGMFDYVMLGGGAVGAGLILASAILATGCGAQAKPVTGTFAMGTGASAGTLILVDTPSAIPAAVRACPAASSPNVLPKPCTVRLKEGNWTSTDLRGMAPPGMVTVDLSGSTFPFFRLGQDSNLTVNGGLVVGGNQWGQCWAVDGASNVTLQNGKADGCMQSGYLMTRSHGISFLNLTITNPGCDGVQVAGVDGFLVSGLHYSGYANSTNTCHADAVQMWAMEGYPLQHGKLLNNVASSLGLIVADGRSYGSQGFTLFNNNGPGGSGYPIDDIEVSGNIAYTYGGVCVALYHVTHAVAVDNQCINQQPEPWKGRYGFPGSTGKLGPNWVDAVVIYGDGWSNTRNVPEGIPHYQGGADLHLEPLR